MPVLAGTCVLLLKKLTPRKGTETHRTGSAPSRCCEKTYTPQGDGNHCLQALLMIGILETTYTPQGDGNSSCDGEILSCIWKQLTPRKGTETYVHPEQLLTANRNNLHPARGRKPARRPESYCLPWETTYTPQGDGNIKTILKFVHFFRNNLHPERGRKLLRQRAALTVQEETAYTPKGDGSFGPNSHHLILDETTYTPKGDGNVTRSSFCSMPCPKQLTPHKGTETA